MLVHNNDASDLAMRREDYVAKMIGVRVAKGPNGQDLPIHLHGVGKSGLDVIGSNGEFVFVDRKAKAKDPAKFGGKLKVSKELRTLLA